MGLMQKTVAAVKKRYDNSLDKKAITLMSTEIVLGYYYKPFEVVLRKIARNDTLSHQDKKRLWKLVKALQTGTGYSNRTRKAFDLELPGVVNRICAGIANEKDKQDMVDVQDFLGWAKQQDKIKILTEKNVL